MSRPFFAVRDREPPGVTVDDLPMVDAFEVADSWPVLWEGVVAAAGLDKGDSASCNPLKLRFLRIDEPALEEIIVVGADGEPMSEAVEI